MKKLVYGAALTATALTAILTYPTSSGQTLVAQATTSDTASASSSGSATSSATPDSASASATAETAPATQTATSTETAATTETATPTETAAGVSGTFTGDSISTRYGPVQVQVTVSGGVITDVQAIDYPTNDHKSSQINARAIPTLNSEAVAAQSSNISFVSGATYTSNAYQQSLQSALDQAGL